MSWQQKQSIRVGVRVSSCPEVQQGNRKVWTVVTIFCVQTHIHTQASIQDLVEFNSLESIKFTLVQDPYVAT